MDYIQEELRRQREALAAVLLGGGARQAPEDGREAVRLFAGALSAVRSAAADRTAAGQTAAETAPGFAIARRPRFAAEGGVAGEYGISAEASAPTAPGGGLPGAGAVIPGEEATALTVESGGASSAARWKRDREALSPAETEALGGRWAAAEPDSPTARRSRGTPAAERTVTELVYPTGGGDAVTAEALSRAFQRDARRYDGGFTPY
nr:hypothetical protein [uncultured Oscillibacter sp.]